MIALLNMTQRGKMISGSWREASRHAPEEKKDFWVKEAGESA